MDYKNSYCYLLANKNLDLAVQLFNEGKHYNWVVTILYYSALMYAKALFELWNLQQPETHRTTIRSRVEIIGWNDAIKNRVDKEAGINFDTLCRASFKYRYRPREALGLDINTTKKYFEFFRKFEKIVTEKYENSFTTPH